MKTAKLFENGRSQAVRLPKECRFDGHEVCVKKHEDMVILFPRSSAWHALLESLDAFSEDFMADRNQPAAQEREFFE